MLEIASLHHVTGRQRAKIGPLADYAIRPDELDAYLRSRAGWEPATSMEQVEAERSIVLTFDDGYRNNLTEALPVLEQHEVPCLLFVTTGFVNETAYPYEIELAAVVERADTLSIPDRSEAISLRGNSAPPFGLSGASTSAETSIPEKARGVHEPAGNPE